MRFAHTNIVARDWKTLSEFYINVFGCTLKPPQRNYSGDWLDQATGLKDAQLEGVHLLMPGFGVNGPTLEIFSYADTHVGANLQANHTGFTHIAFEVADVEPVFKNALAHGAAKLGEITEKTVEGMGVLKLIYFRDPEGNIVEILSWEK